jgi:HK97 family phage major capsid protein
VNFDSTNSIKIPKMTTGTPGGWVSEEGAIPVKEGAFTSITLTPSKLGVITVATREVLARSTPALETILRDSMLRDTAITLDRKFLSNVAAGSGAPSGLFHTDNAPAAITASNTSNAADDAIADLTAMQTAMFTANVPMNNLVWLMHSSKKLALMALRAATGTFYFRDELINGQLFGAPVLDSAVFDFGVNNGGATNIKTVALVDASLLVKGEGLAPTIRMSEEATLHMETAPSADLGGAGDPTPVRSLFQTDCVALRLLWETTWRMRHTVGVQYVSDVNW